MRFVRDQPRPILVFSSLVLVGVVGVMDYLTGFERSVLVFYLVPIALATWFVGRGFAVAICALSVTAWIAGDMAAGARYSSPFVPLWNSLIALISFLIVIWLLARLHALLDELELRVHQRTQALEREILARVRLEKEIGEVSERERQRLGRELHDSLCQHLTGTSLAAQVLGGELIAADLPQAGAAEKVIALVESAIDMTRNLARGLISLELEGKGLCGALQELARDAASRFRMSCTCLCDESIKVDDPLTATHLFRIAQEAVNNALKHSQGKNISIGFGRRDSTLCLRIEDDGLGVPPATTKDRPGLGLRIMAHRAALIGARFELKRSPLGGTIVTCCLSDAVEEPLEST
ncbi:MAG: histidine kinase [Verrucomicrobiota bacterium]|nr:histidine kinase [Verrucomicrobiota bacterium]